MRMRAAVLVLMTGATAWLAPPAAAQAASRYDRPANPVQQWVKECRQRSVVPPVGDRFDCWGGPAQKLLDWLKSNTPPIVVQGMAIYPAGHQGFCYDWKKNATARPLASCKFGTDVLSGRQSPPARP